MSELLITCDRCDAPAPAAIDEYGDTLCERCLAREDAERFGYRQAALDALDRAVDLLERALFTYDEIHEALELRLRQGSDSLERSGLAETEVMKTRYQEWKQKRAAEEGH